MKSALAALLVAIPAGFAPLGADCAARSRAPSIPPRCASASAAPAAPAAAPAARSFIRGLCWEAGPRVTAEDFEPVRAVHAGWISQTPFGWQAGLGHPAIRLNTRSALGFGPFWGETDGGLAETSRLAHQAGIKVALKPHIWLHGGDWCGDIRMRSEADWREWFDQYTTFITHYAALAEREGIEMLCVGTELKNTSSREADWRRVIAAVRRVYRGRLTYAANWDGEVDSVRFWDALDDISVQAYYPLSSAGNPGLAELQSGWRRWDRELERAAARWNRRVIFTEVGYKSARHSAERPWEWEPDGPVDLELQSRCYEALFRTFWTRPWFGGLFLWKWAPRYGDAGGPEDREFTPQHKPAEEVLRRWFSAADNAPAAAR